MAALFVAYLDESGIHDSSPITAVGGFVGHAETWVSFESDWREALGDVGITAFHAVDCEQGNGEFMKLPLELRYALANRLARIIAKADLLGVWRTVINDDWHATNFDDEFKQAHPKPFYLCFSGVAQKLVDWAARRADGSRLSLVYSEQQEFQEHIQEIWKAYNDGNRRGKFSSFEMASYHDCVPLQAADLIAYEMNRDWQTRVYRPDPSPFAYRERIPIHNIRHGGGLDLSGCYDANALQVAMKRFRETGEI